MKIATKIRRQLRWSKYRMAQELGIAQKQLKYIEEEAEICSKPTLLKLCDIFAQNGLGTEGQFWKLFRKLD